MSTPENHWPQTWPRMARAAAAVLRETLTAEAARTLKSPQPQPGRVPLSLPEDLVDAGLELPGVPRSPRRQAHAELAAAVLAAAAAGNSPPEIAEAVVTGDPASDYEDALTTVEQTLDHH